MEMHGKCGLCSIYPIPVFLISIFSSFRHLPPPPLTRPLPRLPGTARLLSVHLVPSGHCPAFWMHFLHLFLGGPWGSACGSFHSCVTSFCICCQDHKLNNIFTLTTQQVIFILNFFLNSYFIYPNTSSTTPLSYGINISNLTSLQFLMCPCLAIQHSPFPISESGSPSCQGPRHLISHTSHQTHQELFFCFN